MNTLDTLVRAAIKVVTTHREMKRAHADGASEEARKRYRKTMIAALDALDRALEAFVKSAPKPGAAPAPTQPFDWNGAVKAGIAALGFVTRVKNAKTSREVIEIIDAEIVP
jgi:hypothetical protein